VGLNVVMYFSRLLPSGLGGKYRFSYLPVRAKKIVWSHDGETSEFKVWERGGHCSARVPLSGPETLLWLKASKSIEGAITNWTTSIPPGRVLKAKLNGAEYFVLPMPPEARERNFEGQCLVWAPKEVLRGLLARLEATFGDLLCVQGTFMQIGEGPPAKLVEGFTIDDDFQPSRLKKLIASKGFG